MICAAVRGVLAEPERPLWSLLIISYELNKRPKIPAIAFCLLLFCFISAPLKAAENGFYPARAMDISDRDYEKAVIHLLDNARESITISMFVLKPGTDARHPINRLMKDLEEALERGVSVTIYINTKFDESGRAITAVGEGEAFDTLREKGAQICPVTPQYMLHDKMIIVDSRYVVIGSTNWSVSALTRNLESSVIIDSPALAKERLERMNTIHLQGEDLRDPPQISLKKIYSLPELIELPRALVNNKRYFPGMLSKKDNRTMDLYLLLIAESERRKSKEFYIALEKLAGKLNLPQDWDAAALRRKVIKSLRKLKSRYRLIDVQFKHSRAAKIKLIDISGETFTLNRGFFDPAFIAARRQNTKFVLLIKAYLEAEEKDITVFSNTELGKMFYVDRTTIREGLQ